MSNRQLSEWETAVCRELSRLGFRYFPHASGSGYWFNQRHGLYLTNDLEFSSRGAGRCWTLKIVEGLLIGTMRLPDKKRKPETTADDIARRIQRIFDTPDWRNLREWGKQSI